MPGCPCLDYLVPMPRLRAACLALVHAPSPGSLTFTLFSRDVAMARRKRARARYFMARRGQRVSIPGRPYCWPATIGFGCSFLDNSRLNLSWANSPHGPSALSLLCWASVFRCWCGSALGWDRGLLLLLPASLRLRSSMWEGMDPRAGPEVERESLYGARLWAGTYPLLASSRTGLD